MCIVLKNMVSKQNLAYRGKSPLEQNVVLLQCVILTVHYGKQYFIENFETVPCNIYETLMLNQATLQRFQLHVCDMHGR